jgi:hypothetical protein
VDKDPSVKGLTFRIHGLAEKLENLTVVKWAGNHSSLTTAASMAMTALMAATAVTTARLR